MVACGLQMAHAQEERLNQFGRCRNPTAGAAPWLAREENPIVATKVVRRNSLLAKSRVHALRESTEKYRQSQKNISQPGGSWMEYVLAIYSTYFMVFIHKSKYHSPTKKAYLENWDWEP